MTGVYLYCVTSDRSHRILQIIHPRRVSSGIRDS